ncbi:O-antigen polysaccharide polymerase Wzy [Frankia sp. AgPm24]|uniref:O-antigen polysaccharide polymerase Wzy n=1 Tax=Frankia sp. AgPm24 TaxID=631128 RepID=UPI00200CF6FA|nr:O-antigen polysaccharide polymerase Wzy [Frankia sp. AgPm24]MCK9921667.1 O-antigen polysaccharide polymerase Wzy [Frankia sp. AgPm24]
MLAFVGCGLALFVVVAWSASLVTLPERAAARVCVLVVAGGVLLCVRAQPRGVWACSSVYLITLSVFHFGVAMLYATGTSFDRLRAQYDFRWLAVYPMSRLFTIATIGVLAATLGVAAVTFWRTLRPATRADATRRPAARTGTVPAATLMPAATAATAVTDGVAADGVAAGGVARPSLRAPAGFVLVAGSAVGLVAIVLGAGGLGLLFGSYEDVGQTALRSPLVPYVLFGLCLGLVLAVIDGPNRWRRATVVVFVLFAVIALPLGLRSEVMFPAVSAAAVAARRRVVVRGVIVLLGAVLLLAFIGGLREIRQSGLAAVRLEAITFSPVDGVAELGASIRPIGAVLDWRDGMGERPAPGSTFYGQVQRLLSGRVLGRPQPSQFDDERLFNVLIMDREGPIGGSPIAEAYYNFGLPGVIVFLFGTGLVVAWMDHGRSRRGTEAACLVLLVPLVIEVRNAFAAVPFQVLLGLVVLGLIHAAESAAARRALARSRRPFARPASARPAPVRPASLRLPLLRPVSVPAAPALPGPRLPAQRLPADAGSSPRAATRPLMPPDPCPGIEIAVADADVIAPPARPRGAGAGGIGRVGLVVTGWLGLAAVASLGQAVVTARMLPLAERGALVVLVTVCAFGALVGGLGTNVAFRHYFGRADPRVGLGHYLGLSLAVTPLAAGLVTLFSLLLLRLSGGARVDGWLLVAVALLAAANLLAAQLLDALNAAGEISLSAAFVAGTSVAQFAVLLLGPRHPGLRHIVVVLAACWGVQIVVCVVELARRGLPVRPRRDRTAWRLLVSKGLPALGLNIGATVAFRFDRLLVAAFGGASAAAVYSVASASCEALRLLPGSVGQVIFHRSARGTLTAATLRRVTLTVCGALCVAAGALALAAPWLLAHLFGAGYGAAVTPMRLLLVAELLLAPFLIECRMLTGLGRTRAAGAVGLAGLLLSVATYPVLVPWLGATGAAIGSMIAYGAMTLLARRALRAHLVAGHLPVPDLPTPPLPTPEPAPATRRASS